MAAGHVPATGQMGGQRERGAGEMGRSTGSRSRSQFRSPAYDLAASVAVAQAVAAAGGDTSPRAVAEALGYRGTNSGAFHARMASARLFGLVAGRGDRVVLTERGQVAATGGPASPAALQAAFRSVPLYAAVAAVLVGRPLPGTTALATLLVEQFGEKPAKAPGVAARLLASAAQAGLLADNGQKAQLIMGAVKSGWSDSAPSNLVVPRVLLPKSPVAGDHRLRRQARREGGAVVARDGWDDDGRTDDGGLWLEDGNTPTRTQRKGYRVAAFVAAGATCLAAVGVPVGLVLADSGGGSAAAMPPDHHHPGSTGHGLTGAPAEQQVLSALSATTDAGSFDFTYALSQTAATTPASTTTSTTTCHEVPVPRRAGTSVAMTSSFSGSSVTLTPSTGAVTRECTRGGPVTENDRTRTVVSGHGVINTNPMGMVATTSLGGIAVRIDGTTVWESSGDGLAPTSGQTGGGTPLASFASLVESTLGTRAGAAAVIGMASPTGYLDLNQAAVNAADQVGTGTAGGRPVTYYEVTLDPTALAQTPGITTQEATAINSALKVLHAQGLQGLQDKVAIDASGYIQSTDSVATFADGGTLVLATTFSNFGCAGTVLMPGQQGAATPPASCTSPDTGVATTTTTAPGTTSSTTAPPASTTTTTSVAPSTTASSTTPASTTTAPPASPTTIAPAPTMTAPPGSTTTTTGP